MSNEQLEDDILEYLYNKKRAIAKRICPGLRLSQGHRSANGTRDLTEHAVRKACKILENRGDLVCVGRERAQNHKHKVYALSPAKRMQMAADKGEISFEDE